MIHYISASTSYLEAFVMTLAGNHLARSQATGFFTRVGTEVYLLTNWHVVSGLNPAAPQEQANGKPPPHYLKVTVQTPARELFAMTLPLYDRSMQPLWFEHPERNQVDLAMIQIPPPAASKFSFLDVAELQKNSSVEEVVGKDAFVVGYPFNKEELRESFGNSAPYYLPTWKRGSIASEPAVRLGGKVILIDTQSRPGMSGSPVFISQEGHAFEPTTPEAAAAARMLSDPNVSALDKIRAMRMDEMRPVRRKDFRFLGIYSGTMGSTKLQEVALGKCWHADVVQEAILNRVPGVMPHHAPVENEHYVQFLSSVEQG